MLGHPKQYRYSLSKNSVSLDNQQERFSRMIYPITENLKWFVSGFVDGEGSFCLNIKQRKDSKYGLRIEPAFYVYQHERGIKILELIQMMFGCGSIHRKSNPSSVFTYQISGIQPCFSKVLPFFETYPLIVKSKTFEIFSKAIKMMHSKEHLTKSGFISLVDYAYEMNQLGKGRKWDKDIVLERILRGYTLDTTIFKL